MDFINEAVLQNGHWDSGAMAFPRVRGRLVEREVSGALERSVSSKFVTVLRGLRRTGKSVLARQVAARRLEGAKTPRQVAWFEFDRAMNATAADLDSLINFFIGQGGNLLVLDEIAFVPKWQDVLKRHYDRSEVKFVVTGSSAIELDRRTAESLAGRFETIEVRPFSLRERLLLEGKQPPGTLLQKARQATVMEAECQEYLQAGGLPEITTSSDEKMRRHYVNNSLLDPLFYKDFPAVFQSANPDLLRKTLELLSSTSGSTFQLQSIAEALGCSHPTAATQLQMLEKTLLVRTVYNSTPSVAKQKRTAKKIVFADTGVLECLNPQASAGVLAENAVLEALSAKFFWRDAEGHEVDAILPSQKIAVEVKYQESITSADWRNLRFFTERKPGWKAVLVTKNLAKTGRMSCIPLWQLLLNPSAITRR